MKTLLRFLVVSLLVVVLTAIAEAKVKPKNLATTAQTQSSIAIDPAGFPHVACLGADGNLYHARFDGRTWQREVVDDSQYYSNAMAIDAQGRIHIVYGVERITSSNVTYSLAHAYFDGASWTVTDLPVSGHHPRIALDASGHPHVLFNFSSSYAAYNGADWQIENTGLSGSWSSDGLALDANGKAHVSANGFYATNKSGTWEITQLMTNNAGATAIALDKAGNPHVVVGTGGELVYYNYDGSNWTSETMVNFNDADPGIQANIESAIAMAMDAQGRAQVMVPVYLSAGNRYGDVSVFVFDDGTGWNGLLLDLKNTGFYPSIALDSNDVAYVTYCGALVHDRSAKAKWARIALPDLTGGWTNVSVAGTAVTGTLNVTNQGLDKSDKTVAALWLSDDATLDDGDTLLPVALKIKSLAAGSKIAVPINFQYAGALAGKQLIAVIDPVMATADRNRLDNTVAISLGP
jgi:hypothetical protein